MNLTYRLFFSKSPRKTLGCLDAFYKMTVSQLGCEARRQYCINLIGRLKTDLRETQCREECRRIREHIHAAKAEIKNLGGKASS